HSGARHEFRGPRLAHRRRRRSRDPQLHGRDLGAKPRAQAARWNGRRSDDPNERDEVGDDGAGAGRPTRRQRQRQYGRLPARSGRRSRACAPRHDRHGARRFARDHIRRSRRRASHRGRTTATARRDARSPRDAAHRVHLEHGDGSAIAMNPIRSALKNRSVVLVLTGFALLLGIGALFTMPRREDPKITIRTGLVLARYPGASAQQVEDQVTRKIEERLFRDEEVRKLKTFSTSRDGVAVVNVELEEWVKDPDRFWAMLRHDLNELHATELPQAVQGPIVNSNFGDVVAMLLAVRGTHYGPRELREYLDRIDDAIRTIPEVSRINRIGEQREELRVSTTNARLAGFGITPAQVTGAIRSRTALVDAGTIDAGDGGRVPIAANNLLASDEALS